MIGRTITMILLLGLLFHSCTNDEHHSQSQNETVNLDINLSPRSANMKVRILITDTRNGEVLINEYPAQIKQDGKYELGLKIGIFDFNVLVNEPDRLTTTLDKVKNQSELSAAIIEFAELPKTENDFGTNETNIPGMKKMTVGVRQVPGTEKEENPPGQVTLDNSKTWSSELNIEVERLATKLSLNLRKNTKIPGDVVTIKEVNITKIPTFGYILPEKPYTGTNFQSLTPYSSSTGITFSQNVSDVNQVDNYTAIFENLILPEYILEDKTDENSAVLIEIVTDYNGETRRYYIRPENDELAKDYRLERNTHYMINGTIVTGGKLDFDPNVGYIVADWEDKNIGTSFVENTAITFTSKWAEGTNITPAQRLVRITGNQSAQFEFILSNPENAVWTATLDNPYDFMFDYTDGAVSTGETSPGNYYKIKIKAKDPNVTSIKETHFYITVYNSPDNVELDLTGQGKENKYVIRQTPF